MLVDLVVAGWRRGRCYIGSAISANRALVSGEEREREIRRRFFSKGGEANRIKEIRSGEFPTRCGLPETLKKTSLAARLTRLGEVI